jgi:hypothetical protein
MAGTKMTGTFPERSVSRQRLAWEALGEQEYLLGDILNNNRENVKIKRRYECEKGKGT